MTARGRARPAVPNGPWDSPAPWEQIGKPGGQGVRGGRPPHPRSLGGPSLPAGSSHLPLPQETALGGGLRLPGSLWLHLSMWRVLVHHSPRGGLASWPPPWAWLSLRSFPGAAQHWPGGAPPTWEGSAPRILAQAQPCLPFPFPFPFPSQTHPVPALGWEVPGFLEFLGKLHALSFPAVPCAPDLLRP